MPSPSISSVGTAYTTPNNATNPMTATGGSMPTHATGDVLLMFAWFDTGATTSAQTLSTPAGWTSLGVDADDLANGMLFHIYFKRAASSGETFTSPSFAGGTTGTSGGTGIVQVATLQAGGGRSFNSGVSAGDLVANSGAATFITSAAQNISSIGGFTPDENDTLIVVYGGKRDDWTSVATLTGDSLTWTEQGEPVSTSGADAGMVWNTAPQTTAGAITAKTFTVTGGGTEKSAGRMFALSGASSAFEKSVAIAATGAIASSGARVAPPWPEFVALGTATVAQTTAITPSMPAGIQTDDVLLLFHANREDDSAPTITNQNGGTWTEIPDSPQLPAGVSTDARLAIFWSRYNGTQGAPTVSASSAGAGAVIAAYRGCHVTGDPFDVTAGGTDATADTSGSIPGDTTTVANCLVVLAASKSANVSLTGWTNADLTAITERYDVATIRTVGVADGVKVTAGAYANTDVTYSGTSTKGLISIALKPPAAATLERSASLTAGGAIASAPQRDLLRQAAISASGTIASSAVFWTTFERSIAITASGSIASNGEIDTVGEFNRSASLDAVASIVSAPQRDLLRQVAIAAAGVIQSTGSSAEILERSVAISATTAISSAGTITSIGVSAIPERREVIASIAAEIELPNGTLLNFNPDEGRDQIPISASFDTEIPGGFSAASLTIARPEYVNVSDLLYGSTRFYVYESNRTLHEGRVVGINDNGTELSLEIEGWSRALQDNKTCRQIYYDRDFSHWRGMSVERSIAQAQFGAIADGGVSSDKSTGEAALVTETSESTEVESWYDAGGMEIAKLDWAHKADTSDSLWYAMLTEEDVHTTVPPSNTTGNYFTDANRSGTLTASGSTKIFATVQHSTGPISRSDLVMWTLLGVIGNHGLTLQGTVAFPKQGRGIYGHHIVEHIIETFVPVLTVGEVETTTFAVPHLAFLEPVTPQEMLESVAIYGGSTSYPLDWGIYDNRTFFAATPFNFGTVWRVRLDEGAEQSGAGLDAQRMLTGVVIKFDDGSGDQYTVGPPNSGSDHETADLEDLDEANPATRDGSDHWELFDAGVTSQGGAVLIGQLILAERNRQEWRGDVTVKDAVRDDAGNWHSVAMMRSGDRLIIEDDPDLDFRERRIVNTKHDNRVTSCSVGARPDRLDVLLARLGVVLVGRL